MSISEQEAWQQQEFDDLKERIKELEAENARLREQATVMLRALKALMEVGDE